LVPPKKKKIQGTKKVLGGNGMSWREEEPEKTEKTFILPLHLESHARFST